MHDMNFSSRLDIEAWVYLTTNSVHHLQYSQFECCLVKSCEKYIISGQVNWPDKNTLK